jgi:hypothetical protein
VQTVYEPSAVAAYAAALTPISWTPVAAVQRHAWSTFVAVRPVADDDLAVARDPLPVALTRLAAAEAS